MTEQIMDVKNAVSDGDSNFCRATCAASPKDSEGQILDGKIRAGDVGRVYPALYFGIMSLVEDGFHRSCFIAGIFIRGAKIKDRKSSMGSVNEHDPNEIAKFRRAAAISSRLSRCWRQAAPSKSKWNA
jgi:hypothetical protein